ncbi:hypothetical protein WA158_004888 [Blastocystis sp. Blastoise]
MMLSRLKCDPVVYVLSLGVTCSDGLKGSSMLFVSYGGCGVACYANCEGSSVVLNDGNGSNDADVGSSCFIDGSSDAFNTAVDVIGDQTDCSYGIKGSFIDVGPSILMESSIIGNDTGSSSQLRYHGYSSVPSLEGVFSNRGSYHPNVSFHFNNKNVSKVMV